MSEALIQVDGLPNLRDLGGWPTDDGRRVQAGRVYRSVDLSKLDPDGVTAFAALGIRTVYDLRTEPERTSEPDRLPTGTDYVVADILAGDPSAAPAQLFAMFEHPERTADALSDGRAQAMFTQGYRAMVSRATALAGYHELFTGLADSRRRPALFHCTTGKDRTGWGAAALLMLLGVSGDDVMRDYLLTNTDLVPALQPVFDKFAAAGGDPDLLLLVLGVHAEYLGAALDEMRTRYRDIRGYFRDGLGIDAAGQDALRDALLD